MSALSTGRDLVQRVPTSGIVADSHHVQIPMLQQSPLGSHGHDMYPQEFVRLSGCQDSGARGRQAPELH
jgi:hypothetical protein